MQWLKRMIVIGAAMSILSIVAVLLYTATDETLPSLLAVQPIYLLAAILLHAISYGIWGFRISVLCRSLGERVSVVKSTEIATSSLLMMAVTPSSAGGEPVMVYMLAKEGITPGKASAIVVAGRLFDALLLLLALPLALITLKRTSLELDILLISAALTGILVIAAILLAISNHLWFISAVTAFAQRIASLLGLGQMSDAVIEKIEAEVLEFRNSFTRGIRDSQRIRSDMLLVSGATLLFWIVEFMHIPLILGGLNVPNVPALIPLAFAAQVIISIVMVVPITPGASGVAELSSTALLATFVPLHLVGIVVICWRAVTYYVNVVVGAVVSARIVRNMDFIRSMSH